MIDFDDGRRRDGGCRAIDLVMFGKTAMPVIPRLAANSIVAANATPEKIDAATAKLWLVKRPEPSRRFATTAKFLTGNFAVHHQRIQNRRTLKRIHASKGHG